ncbi:hypothetical protein ATANTOWER_021088, partial [Ataeniobius toweri]|nr:hypothetical protein [Ataeniobius toweri]
HKKKRRRSRWSTGHIAKRKPSSSPHVSRDDARYASEEDGDDEDEVGKEATESATDHEGSSELSASQVEETEKKSAAEEETILHDEEKLEGDIQAEAEEDKAVQHQSEQFENNIRKDENNESISDNTEKDSCAEEEGDTQHAIAENMIAENQCETLIERSHSAEDQNFKVGRVDEAELNTPAEPMVVDVTETSTTDATAAARSETDTNTERNVRRMTRALKNTVLQQHRIPVDKALQILNEESPPLVVDRDKLKELLDKVVTKTEGYEVYKLEKLYAVLCQSIYSHRLNYNKTTLIQELEQRIQDF